MENKNIVTVFIAVILGIAFLSALASITLNNTTLITGIESENNVNFTEGEYILDIINTYSNAECHDIEILNSTSGLEVIGEGNYTFYSTNCTYVVQTDSAYKDENVNLSYSYESEPEGYIESSITRTLIGIVLGLFALFILLYLIAYLMEIFGNKI